MKKEIKKKKKFHHELEALEEQRKFGGVCHSPLQRDQRATSHKQTKHLEQSRTRTIIIQVFCSINPSKI